MSNIISIIINAIPIIFSSDLIKNQILTTFTLLGLKIETRGQKL